MACPACARWARGAPAIPCPAPDSQAAKDLLEERFPPQQNGVNPIVFDVVDGQAHRRRRTSRRSRVGQGDAARHRMSPASPTRSAATARPRGCCRKDGQTAFAPVLLDIGSGDLTTELAQQSPRRHRRPRTEAGIRGRGRGLPRLRRCPTDDTESSEVVGIVAAMIILTLVFGSLVAMGHADHHRRRRPRPSRSASSACSATSSRIPSIGPTLATMIGLGVGIDYALFLVTRHQEQLGDGHVDRTSRSPARSRPRAAPSCSPAAPSSSRSSRCGSRGIPLVSALG